MQSSHNTQKYDIMPWQQCAMRAKNSMLTWSHIIALLKKAWMKGYNQVHIEDSRHMSFALRFSSHIMLKAHFKSIKLRTATNEMVLRVSRVWQTNKRMRYKLLVLQKRLQLTSERKVNIKRDKGSMPALKKYNLKPFYYQLSNFFFIFYLIKCTIKLVF